MIDKEFLRKEIKEELVNLELVGKTLERILSDNAWAILEGELVFDNLIMNRIYNKIVDAWNICSKRLEGLEQECRDNKYLDILRDTAELKFEKGII